MAKRKRPERPRTLRRELARGREKLAHSRRKLLSLESGGSAQRPIDVESASVVEPRAGDYRCPDCEGRLRCEEHRAVQHEGRLLREAHMRCRECGAPLVLYFRIVSSLLN